MDSTNNPTILAIETSGRTCGVALVVENSLRAEYTYIHKTVHDEFLANLTKRILEDSSLTVSDLDAIAVSAGPGSFTGLRIGASFAKGLCFDNSPKLIAVPTLSAMASAGDEVAMSFDADSILTYSRSHKDVFYSQRFLPDATPINEVHIVDEEFIRKEITLKTVICSDGSLTIDSKSCIYLSGLQRISPRFTLRQAMRMFVKNQFVHPTEFSPKYEQDFVVFSKAR
jgi:tRNA threonylcarbamoyladenosine biosynthesis protein TsaB